MRIPMGRFGACVGALVLLCCSSSSGNKDATDGGGDDGAQGGPEGGKKSHADGGGGSDGSGGAGGSGGSGGEAGSTNDAGTVGGVPGGKAGPGASITTPTGTCQIFPDDNPWNVAIDGPDVEVIHDYDSELPQGTELHPDWGGYTKDKGGIPYNAVPSTQADVSTIFSVSASQSDPGPMGWVGADPNKTGASKGTTAYPFFVGMEIEGDPKAGGTPGKLAGDQHAIALQTETGACVSYEAWNCVVASAPPIACANGAVFNLGSNALRPAGWTSGDAAGLSILAGLVRFDEVTTGAKSVNHAIRVTFNATQEGYIPPATHAASKNALGSAYPPMGLRIRLKASVVTSSFTPASQVILAAMKKYGLLVADNGSDWFVQGASDDRWTEMAPDGKDSWIDEIVGDFRSIKGSDFEAVYTGKPVNTGL